jgi:hypothetical protein
MSSASRCRLAVVVCCLVATLGYSGAVTTTALATLVVPAVLAAIVVTLAFERLAGPAVAAGVGIGVALVLGQLVNVASGEYNGPAARSTFLAGVGSALAIAFARRWPPGAVCLPICAVLGGALFLGAAGEVVPVAAVLVTLLAMTVPLLEGPRRRPVGNARTTLLLPVLALLAGVVAFGAARLSVTAHEGAPKVFAIAQVQEGIEPLHDAPSPAPATDPATTHPSAARAAHSRLVIAVTAVALVLLGLLLVRLAVVAWAWRRVRRRLRRGTPLEVAVGAWSWALLRLHSYGVVVPTSVSPDRLPALGEGVALSPAVAAPLRVAARLASDAAFAPAIVTDGPSAWQAADQVVVLRRRELSRWRRALVTLRAVPAR